MLNHIIAFSIRNKLIIGLMVMALVIYGAFETTRLPIDAVPDITNNQVQIITVAPAYGATDIERLVTFPVEQANCNIAGIKEIRSFSRFGLSLVTIVFTDKTDIYWARQQVSERLQKIQSVIPPAIGTPELGPISTGLGEIYQYVVKAQKGYENQFTVTDLRTIQDWVVRRQLLGVEGVAEVSSFGGKLKQYEVAVNSDKLNAYNLDISKVFNAIEANNANTGGSYIEKGPTALFIKTEGLLKTKEEIKDITVGQTAMGTPVTIADIAEVNTGFATRYGAMCYNDEGEVAGAIVMMLKGENSNKVIANVKERIDQIKRTLPKGVTIEPFLDRTKMVNNAIGTVEKNLSEGALIVVFILVLFLGNLRAGLLVASVIPLSMLFAIILMNTFKVSGNLMSLGALDFGLIVDGAVIIVEAVMHQLSHSRHFSSINRLSQPQMDETVKKSAGKMMNSAVFGQIIILIVYLPILSLQGIEGKMFKPMAQTVAFALLGAFILSLTYIPMMSALVLSKKVNQPQTFSDRWMAKIESVYQRLLKKLFRSKAIILSSVAALFGLAVAVLTQLGGEFIPALEEGDFAVDTRVLTGSNINTTIAYTQKAAGLLKSTYPEVEKVVTKIGSGEVPTDPMPMEAADMMIILKPKSEWKSAKTFEELSNKMGKTLQAVPGITTGFQYPVQMRFNELMTGARQDVVCKIFGEDLDSLVIFSRRLGSIIETVNGTTDLYLEPVGGMPQIVINYKRAALARYHVDVETINKIVQTAFAGRSTGQIFEGEKRFDLVVRLADQNRDNIEDIRNLLIPLSQGNQLPLNQLAEVTLIDGPNQIQREDAKRRIIAGFNVRGRDVQSIVEELQAKVVEQLHLPAGYYITYGGAFENLKEAKNRLMIAVPVSLILIFLLLYFAFGSIKQGILIYTTIPLSAIGGIAALALRGMPFSISAGIGFIALFGVAVLNGIVLISEFNRLKNNGMKDLNKIVFTGTKVRLRPVLMTAAVASLGFLPMALSNGAGAEVQRPLATVVIGGLVVATFLTLFVLPMLYVLAEKLKKTAGIKHATVVPLLCLAFLPAKAQNTLTLTEAVNLALNNNLLLKNQMLQAEYKEHFKATAFQLPATVISGQYGQINSIYKDNQFSVSQSMSFPLVYAREKKMLTNMHLEAVEGVNQQENDLKKKIYELYATCGYMQERMLLLHKTDSLLALQVEKMVIRKKTGESDAIELSAVTARQLEMQLQKQELAADILSIKQQVMQLLQLNYLPELKTEVITQPVSLQNTSLPASHPLTKMADYQQKAALNSVSIERSKLLPDVFASYNSMTMYGNGADNEVYNYTTRFNSVQAGLALPLFYNSQKARINAARTQLQMAENNTIQVTTLLKSELQNTKTRYAVLQENLQTFTKQLLPQAETMLAAATQQYKSGETSYIAWLYVYTQALHIEQNYLETKYNAQLAGIQLNYLLNNL